MEYRNPKFIRFSDTKNRKKRKLIDETTDQSYLRGLNTLQNNLTNYKTVHYPLGLVSRPNKLVLLLEVSESEILKKVTSRPSNGYSKYQSTELYVLSPEDKTSVKSIIYFGCLEQLSSVITDFARENNFALGDIIIYTPSIRAVKLLCKDVECVFTLLFPTEKDTL